MGAACRPDLAAALPSSPALGAPALPLPFCFLTSILGAFDFGARDGFCLPPGGISPTLADAASPLPACLLASSAGAFGFRTGKDIVLPDAPAPELAYSPLPLSCGFLASS